MASTDANHAGPSGYAPADVTRAVLSGTVINFPGDAPSLTKASAMLDSIIKLSPDFAYGYAQKAMVDVLRHSQQPFDSSQLVALSHELDHVANMPELQNSAVLYRIQAIDALAKAVLITRTRLLIKALSWKCHGLIMWCWEKCTK